MSFEGSNFMFLRKNKRSVVILLLLFHKRIFLSILFILIVSSILFSQSTIVKRIDEDDSKYKKCITDYKKNKFEESINCFHSFLDINKKALFIIDSKNFRDSLNIEFQEPQRRDVVTSSFNNIKDNVHWFEIETGPNTHLYNLLVQWQEYSKLNSRNFHIPISPGILYKMDVTKIPSRKDSLSYFFDYFNLKRRSKRVSTVNFKNPRFYLLISSLLLGGYAIERFSSSESSYNKYLTSSSTIQADNYSKDYKRIRKNGEIICGISAGLFTIYLLYPKLESLAKKIF